MSIDLTKTSTLYIDDSLFCEGLRYLMYHKGLHIKYIYGPPQGLADITLPVFIHNKFLVAGRHPTLEFLNEFFPDPPAMPLDPTNRAIHRMVLRHVLEEWFPLFSRQAFTDVCAQLNESTQAFEEHQFFLSDSPMAVDCFLYSLLNNMESERFRLDTQIIDYHNALHTHFLKDVDDNWR